MTKDKPAYLPYGHQWIDATDIESVIQALSDDWITTGPRVDAFERAVADFTGANHGVAVSSGTAALYCACQAAGLVEGDEAAVSVLSFEATANAVRLTGAEVRFTDIDSQTWGMSAETLTPVFSEKTKAVLPVDFAGQPCDWDQLTDCISERGIVSVADAAHAIGAAYKGRAVGSMADMTCFSFHPVKTITTAEGGMIVTNSDAYAAELRRLRNHGLVRSGADFLGTDEVIGGGDPANGPAPWYYEIHEPGLNCRISDLQCALGLSQIQRLPAFITRRQELAAYYTKAFAETELLKTPTLSPDRESAWHLYVIRLNLSALMVSRRKFLKNCSFGV